MLGKFLDDVKSGFNNSANIKNPFGSSGGGSFGSMLGDMLGDAVDTVKQAAGAIAPFFESEEAATQDLLNKLPEWLDPKEAMSVGLDEKTDRAYPSMTHIRNWVRAEFLRREHNFGVFSTVKGEYAHRQIMEGSIMDAAFITHSPDELDYDDKKPRTAEMFLSDSYVGQTYKGPKTAWCRVVSNTIKTIEGKEFEGFVLHGVDNFDDMYGFGETNDGDFKRDPGETVLGFDCNKNPHILREPDFTHRPPPNITEIDSEEMGPGKAQRKTTIKFSAHSRAQLDYISSFFFQTGNTLLVEWGWNTFPRAALIDISDVGSPPTYASKEAGKGKKSDALRELNQINRVRQSDPDRALPDLTPSDIKDGIDYVVKDGTGLVGIWNSTRLACRQLREGQGNYSFTCGMISNFTYSINDTGGYDCTVEILSMAQFATQLNKSASQAEDAGGKRLDERVLDLEVFVNDHLEDIISGDTNESFSDLDNYQKSIEKMDGRQKRNSNNSLQGHGRYFSFGNIGGGLFGTENNKQYFAGSPSDGKYITLGYLVDIINAFFARESEKTGASMWEFVIKHKRCTAHPNIKSTDGDVLLIPNGMAPRHNTEQYDGTTIGLGGEGDRWGPFEDDPINEGKFFDDEKKDDAMEAAFISMVEQLNNMGPGTITDLNEAMKKSPRDDLHLLMTLHPELDDEEMTTQDDYRVDPFPDYKSDKQNQTLGYSGRIQDLFVNLKIVKEAVKNNQTATTILSSILKRMSNASGGIWDFHLVGEDPASPNNTKLTIEDRNFSSNTVDEVQRTNKTFIFKAHQKNSIIRSMSCDVSIPGEVAGMVLYGGEKSDGDSAFYARKDADRILKKAKPPLDDVAGTQDDAANNQADAKIPSEEKFIMGIRVYDGATSVTGEVFSESKMGESKQGQRLMDFGGEVIDIEFVDPDKNRMKSLLKKDRNPKNCVKYNMALAGIELNIQLDGIEGIRLWDVFNCTGVPTQYYMTGVWRVTSVKHSISGNDWKTDITAQFAPNSNDLLKGEK